MPDRRFRDMRLTEDEVEAIVFANLLPGHENHDTHELVDRAKRLLPLWREWGLRELAGKKAIGETSLGRLEYKGPWPDWLSWFQRAPLSFPADYQIVFRVTQPRKKQGDQ